MIRLHDEIGACDIHFANIFCSHLLLPYVGQWGTKLDCKLLPPLSGPGLGVASTPQPAGFVYWGQCQVLTMAPPSLSGLVFKAMGGGVHVLEMCEIKAALSALASVQTAQIRECLQSNMVKQ